MVPHCSDGWRILGPKDPMVELHNAKNGWRKRTDYGAVYVFEHHLPTSPGKYKRRYMMEVSVSASPCEARITIDLPTNVAPDFLGKAEVLLTSLGAVTKAALAGLVQR